MYCFYELVTALSTIQFPIPFRLSRMTVAFCCAGSPRLRIGAYPHPNVSPLKACATPIPTDNTSATSDDTNTPRGIVARNVSFSWPSGRRALTDVNVNVRPGELAMLVGRNGCGKSTLLSVLRTVIFPDEGQVEVESPVAYLRQDPDLAIAMPTIGDDIAISVENMKHKTKEQVRQDVYNALEYVGLVPAKECYGRRALTLSGGQRQRAVLAAALVRNPKTFLFDEVTASVDPVSRADILDRVRSMVTEKNVAALWVTHVFDELDAADTIIIMEGGRVVQQGAKVLMMPLVYELEESDQ